MKVYLYAILILLLMILVVGWFFVDKFKDLYDEANQPNNPEEAIAYIENREKEGPRVIPV
ncbi:hypothetical protein [Clostridium sp. CCUG 7971]|uniref:hypothetical protein n=1 Tax=Clostridium sp. CCUG 7971 TaxID=2811414 RepID=UPI001ABA8917|nr:hypothetical protein [Clostridium sp. CCUG 7971]MBO3443073.1 hypothetical protein [Clostridium sp. CCUG 7971]